MFKKSIDYYNGIKEGSLLALSKAITLVESSSERHEDIALELLDLCNKQNSDNSLRLGISGMPGAGKSTFIENIALKFTENNEKIAILAIDPSSPISKGSILGDKTRMEKLIQKNNIYIRPSANSGELGGISKNTMDTIKLCETFGFNKIIIETVGIGQSETLVKNISDVFILIILPAGGDQLQGIKKGSVELADFVIINKSDGDNKLSAELTMREYKNSFHIIKPELDPNDFVLSCSAIEDIGVDEIIKKIDLFADKLKEKGEFFQTREKQEKMIIESKMNDILIKQLLNSAEIIQKKEDLYNKINERKICMLEAKKELIKLL